MAWQAAPLPPEVEPLVLWEPAEGEEGNGVEVDPMLTTFLRPHQREGVQFMFECVAGLKEFEGQGEALPYPEQDLWNGPGVHSVSGLLLRCVVGMGVCRSGGGGGFFLMG